ncbi:TetR/AcrR family transcriptional regulator [Deinococcus aquatilis]|uniref:TetR/AcrR family transcriptional regulator n=1 Tax=Deinococcus aquatilis TaxID=519440 RepID=UPI0003A40389|nr:TetR/AcrR family transcriptional regulator [Deinococcus aquatilis]
MSKALNVQPRRQPRQIRSDRRVSKILDAAIHVFAELGFEGTTTTAIAARADVSVGSLYQYFPNKAAIVHALSDRFDAAFFIALDGVLSSSGSATLEEMIDAFFETLTGLDRAQPGLFQVLAGSYSSAEFLSLERHFNAAVAQHIAAALPPYLPALSEEQRMMAARLCVESTHAAVHLAALSPVEHRAELLQEAKVLLLSYLNTLSLPLLPP